MGESFGPCSICVQFHQNWGKEETKRKNMCGCVKKVDCVGSSRGKRTRGDKKQARKEMVLFLSLSLMLFRLLAFRRAQGTRTLLLVE